MSKIIFEESVADDITEKGGYVAEINNYFVATIYKVDHSRVNHKLYNSKTSTFVYTERKLAIDYAKTGITKRW